MPTRTRWARVVRLADAVLAITPLSGSLLHGAHQRLPVNSTRRAIAVTDEQVSIFAGSTEPLVFTVRAFCSPTASYVTADPGFEAGLFAAEKAKARVMKVPLTKDYAHDVKAMIAAAPDAGLFYICNPNNPTGTLTSHSDIEYLLDNKPKNSVVLLDEAYIHFSDAASAIDFVKAGKDVIVLRTFSKLYGMAGLRCGFAIARPDLLARIQNYGGYNFMPVTAVAAASASLSDPRLLSERKANQCAGACGDVPVARQQRLFIHIPSQANFFLLDTKHPAKEVVAAMAQQNVIIGRVWPAMPNYSRVTIGTGDEMLRFQAALQKTMKGSVAG